MAGPADASRMIPDFSAVQRKRCSDGERNIIDGALDQAPPIPRTSPEVRAIVSASLRHRIAVSGVAARLREPGTGVSREVVSAVRRLERIGLVLREAAVETSPARRAALLGELERLEGKHRVYSAIGAPASANERALRVGTVADAAARASPLGITPPRLPNQQG